MSDTYKGEHSQYPDEVDQDGNIDEIVERFCDAFEYAYDRATYYFAHMVVNNKNYELHHIQYSIDNIDTGYETAVAHHGEKQAKIMREVTLHFLQMLKAIVKANDDAFEYYMNDGQQPADSAASADQ